MYDPITHNLGLEMMIILSTLEHSRSHMIEFSARA